MTGKSNKTPFVAFRISKIEDEFLKDKQEEYGINRTDLIRFCIRKTFIQSDLTIEQIKKELFR